MHPWGALKIVSTVLFSVNSHLEWTVQSLGLQVPDVNAVVKTPTDQKLRGGAQTHTGLPFLKRRLQRALICDSLTFTGNKSPNSDITNFWYVCVSRHKCLVVQTTAEVGTDSPHQQVPPLEQESPWGWRPPACLHSCLHSPSTGLKKLLRIVLPLRSSTNRNTSTPIHWKCGWTEPQRMTRWTQNAPQIRINNNRNSLLCLREAIIHPQALIRILLELQQACATGSLMLCGLNCSSGAMETASQIFTVSPVDTKRVTSSMTTPEGRNTRSE